MLKSVSPSSSQIFLLQVGLKFSLATHCFWQQLLTNAADLGRVQKKMEKVWSFAKAPSNPDHFDSFL